MHRLQNMAPYEIVNVSYESDTDFLEEAGELTHMIGVLTTKSDISSNLDTFPVKAYTWAVFPNAGTFPFTLQDTMARIYSEWFMSSDYELAESFSFSFTKIDEEKPDYAYSEMLDITLGVAACSVSESKCNSGKCSPVKIILD